jgi:hypothetical protein
MAWSKKGFELDFRVAQDVWVGRAASAVLTQKFGKHAVFVLGGEVDVFDLDAQHFGHRGCVYEIDIARAIGIVVTRSFGSIVILPIFHKDANNLVTLLFE